MARETREDPLLAASPWWTLFRTGLPLALGMASHALVNLVDLAMVGTFGREAVAGVHVATTINFLPMILGNGVSIAALAGMSRRLGAHDVDGAQRLSARAFVLMLWLGLILGLLGAALVAPGIDLQGAEGEARNIGIHYLLVSQLGCVTMFALMQTTATMRAVGEVLVPVLLLVGANLLNLGLNFVFMFGVFDMPGLGAPGAAYASVLARLLAAAAGLWWILRRGHALPFVWPGITVPWQVTRELLRLGLPQTGQMLVRAISIIALTRIGAEVAGPSALAALGVTTRLDSMVLFACMGFASAATALVGRQVGAGRIAQAESTCIAAGFFAAGFAGVLVLGFALYAETLVDLFVDGAGHSERQQGALYLRIAAIAHLPAGFCIAMAGGLNGAGRMLQPMLLDLAGYLLLVLPLALLAAWWGQGMGLAPVWWSLVLSNGLLLLGYLIYVRSGRWRPAPLSA